MTSLSETFDASAGDYDDARRKLVPCFDQFYPAAIDSLPFDRESEFEVLDLGAGTGMLSALIAYSFPRVRITLVDISAMMLAKARERLAAGGTRFHFATLDYQEAPIERRYDAIVSALSIHYLSDRSKRALFRKVYDAIQPGGVFVNGDQIRGETAAIEDRNRALWLQRVDELRAGEPDLRAALRGMELDQTTFTNEQLEWLREPASKTLLVLTRT